MYTRLFYALIYPFMPLYTHIHSYTPIYTHILIYSYTCLFCLKSSILHHFLVIILSQFDFLIRYFFSYREMSEQGMGQVGSVDIHRQIYSVVTLCIYTLYTHYTHTIHTLYTHYNTSINPIHTIHVLHPYTPYNTSYTPIHYITRPTPLYTI